MAITGFILSIASALSVALSLLMSTGTQKVVLYAFAMLLSIAAIIISAKARKEAIGPKWMTITSLILSIASLAISTIACVSCIGCIGVSCLVVQQLV